MLKKIGFSCCFLIPLVFYLTTLSPTVNFVDSGELMVASRFLGIAHPTGYPLYTLLGHFFASIPFGTLALRMNFFSALWGCLTCAVVFLAIRFLLDRSKNSPLESFCISCSGALLCGSSLTLWQSSTQTEVYSLTAFLFSLILLRVFTWLNNKDYLGLILISYLVGIGLGNHLSLVWVIPGILTMVVFALRKKEFSVKALIPCAFFFGLGLSVYFYLPVRTSPQLPLNWGAPYPLERLVWHISGKQYRVWMFDVNWTDKIPDYLRLLTDQFSPYLVWLGIPGFFIQFGRSRKIGGLLSITWLLNVFFALNYSIPDVDTYFIPSFIIWSIWMAFSLNRLNSWIPSLRFRTFFVTILVGLFLIPLLTGWPQRARNRNFLAENLGRNVLNSVEPNAIVFTDIWDLKSTSFFLQQVENLRPDVWVIDFPLMKRSWYIQQLLTQHAAELEACRPSFEKFLKEVAPFEHDLPYQSQVIEGAYVGMVNCIVDHSIAKRPIYCNFPSYPGIAEGYLKIPTGFFFRLSPAEIPLHFTAAGISYDGLWDKKMIAVQDERIREILSRYWILAWFRGNYALSKNDNQEAILWLERARQLNPDEKRIGELVKRIRKEKEERER